MTLTQTAIGKIMIALHQEVHKLSDSEFDLSRLSL